MQTKDLVAGASYAIHPSDTQEHSLGHDTWTCGIYTGRKVGRNVRKTDGDYRKLTVPVFRVDVGADVLAKLTEHHKAVDEAKTAMITSVEAINATLTALDLPLFVTNAEIPNLDPRPKFASPHGYDHGGHTGEATQVQPLLHWLIDDLFYSERAGYDDTTREYTYKRPVYRLQTSKLLTLARQVTAREGSERSMYPGTTSMAAILAQLLVVHILGEVHRPNDALADLDALDMTQHLVTLEAAALVAGNDENGTEAILRDADLGHGWARRYEGVTPDGAVTGVYLWAPASKLADWATVKHYQDEQARQAAEREEAPQG